MINYFDTDREDSGNFKQYKNLIEAINDIVFQVDVKGNWSFLNNSWKKEMGYEVSEVLGKPFFSYLHPDDVETNFKFFQPLIEQKKEYCSHETRYITKSGKVLWFKVFAILLKDETGNVEGVTGTFQNISSEKHNRDFIKLLSENINDLVCLHEIDGSYKYVSPSITAITGYSAEDLIGKNPVSFFHPGDVKMMSENHHKLMDHGSNNEYYINYRFRIKNGTYKWFETSTKMILDEDGKTTGFIASSRGIDNRKKTEELILKSLQKERELNQLKSNFVSLTSHEFRTPLACIRSSVELTEIYASKSGNVLPYVLKHTQNILSEIDRLSSLIDKVLTVSKIESQGLTCRKEPIDLVALLDENVNNIEKIQKDKRAVTIEIEGTPRLVMADPLLLSHAVTNLISNAFKYSIGRHQPIIYLTFNKSSFTIMVKDFGIGVPGKDQKKIFTAFHRAENTHNIEGTGLGLFITKKFIELHKGTITFNSVEQKGSEFTIKINSSPKASNLTSNVNILGHSLVNF